MGSFKSQSSDVKPFQFGKLVPDENGAPLEEDFKLKSLKDGAAFKNNITEDIIRTERGHEAASSFAINPLVREHRGIVNQEDTDYEQRVAQEVTRRVEELSKQAYEDGHSKGLEEGHAKAYEEALVQYEEHINNFCLNLQNITEDREKILKDSEQESYRVVKNLVKWIVLKEVDDLEYIPKLLTKLILEINSKNHLLVRVSEKIFNEVPEALEIAQRKVGELTNTRVEIDHDIEGRSIVLESENGIVDGSLEAQFKSIDKLFESVGVNE